MRNGTCRIKRSKIRYHIYEDIKLYNCLLVVYICYFSNFFSFFFSFSFNVFTSDMIACHGYITFSLLFSSTIMSSSFVFSALPTHTHPFLHCFTLHNSTLKPLHLSVTHSPHRHVSAEDRYICQTHNTANKFRLHFA